MEGINEMIKVDKVVRLFKRSVDKLKSNTSFTLVGVNYNGLHSVFTDDRGNTHAIKGIHIKETGDVQLWYAGASADTHLIQTEFKSVKRLVELVTKVYAQEHKD